MDPVHDPASTAQKPAIKTLEAWASIAVAVLGALMASGVIADGTTAAKIIGAVLAVASALGITTARTLLKMNGNQTAAAVAVAKVSAQALTDPQ